MKKIGIILTSAPREGGEHQYAVQVAECLRKNQGSEYELIGICSNSFWIKWCRENQIRYKKYSWAYFDESEIKFNYQMPFVAKIYNSFFTPVGRWFRKEKMTAVFCTQQGIFLPAYFIKIIRPIHDLMHRYESHFPEVKGTCHRRELLFRSITAYSAVILAESELGRQQITECYLEQSRSRTKIEILPYTVPDHIVHCEEEYIKVPEKYVFYPAQFWKHKNHIHLLKAIRLLKAEIDDIHLVLAGSEKNCLKEIRKFIAENYLEENIQIAGFVDDRQIAYLYRHAVALVMPTYFGPTNIPPLEAMASGCPVAVSDKYAMREQTGEAGLYFDPESPEEIAECIKKMWTDENLRKSMIESGYQKISKWTQTNFDNKLMTIIKNSF